MIDLKDNLVVPIFDREIKFYFSLLFTTIEEFDYLINFYGEDINIFDRQPFFNQLKDVFKVNKIFEEIKDTYDRINLSDKVLLKLFSKSEIEDYYNSYGLKNVNFNIDDANDLNDFYTYMFLERVKEKKQVEYGTIYDFFDTFLDEEIINAVANLDYEDKKKFIYLFGIKGDITFELNTNDYVKKDILIRLYIYMLEKRDDCDIPKIISNVTQKEAYQHNFFDYIRSLCKDNSLSNEFIFKMLSKMDHNSIRIIKEVFGNDLKKKPKPPKDKTFKTAINNLTIIINVNKAYENEKMKSNVFKEKKKAGFETEKESLKQENKEGKTKIENRKEIVIEKPEKDKNEKTDDIISKKTKEEKVVKEDNKKLRLELFLEENNLNKNDFYKAFKLLDPLSKNIISLYYGVEKKPLELDDIAEKLGKELDEVLIILEDAENDIIDLIKMGKINPIEETKKEPPKEKKEDKKKIKAGLNKTNRLLDFVKENEIGTETLTEASLVLAPIEKIVVDLLLNDRKKEEIVEVLHSENVEELIDDCTDKMINLISPQKVIEEKQSKKEEPKDKKLEEKKEQNNNLLNEFLWKNKLSKKDFYSRFKTLDSFSKLVLSCYFGLDKEPLNIYDIALKYGRTIEEIEDVIKNAKTKISKTAKKVEKLNLNMLLFKNKITKGDFNNAINNLDMFKKNLIKAYFGIGMFPMDLLALSKKYGKTPEEINQLVNSIVGNIKPVTKEKKEEVLLSKLDKFLIANNLTKLEFFTLFKSLPLENKRLISMYLGLYGKEFSIPQIAIMTKTNPLLIKNNIENALETISYLAKVNNPLGKNNDMNNNIYDSYSNLFNDANFISLVGKTNPMMVNILFNMRKNGFDIDKTSMSLNLSRDEVMHSLMDLSAISNSYFGSIDNNVNNTFNDREKQNKKSGRKY